jgi:hypothetical protein
MDILLVPNLQFPELRILLEDLPHDCLVHCRGAVFEKDGFPQLLDIVLSYERVNLESLLIFNFVRRPFFGPARSKEFLDFCSSALVECCETLPFAVFV